MDKMIAFIAKWWADTLRTVIPPSVSNPDDHPDAWTRKQFTIIRDTMQGILAQRILTVEKIDAFEARLAHLLTHGVPEYHTPSLASDLKASGCVFISVDYDPCPVLRTAARQAFDSDGKFLLPEKTRMWVYRDRVEVACGYGAPREEVWKQGVR